MFLFEMCIETEFKNLNDMDFESWKEHGNLLNLENEQTINSFYELEYNATNPPYYHCLPIYNSSTSNSQYKFLLVNKDNDQLFIAFKVISFINVKLIKVVDTPISKARNIQNVKEIIGILEQKSFIKFVYKEKYAEFFSKVGTLSKQNCDYFYNYEQQMPKYTNKYFTKNHFHRFESQDFNTTFEFSTDLNELFKLRKQWEQTKTEQGVEVAPKLKRFKSIMKVLDTYQGALFLSIYYKGELILNYCFVHYSDCCFINLYRTSISRTSNNTDESWIKNTFSRLDKYAVYRALKFFKEKYNINYFYFGGFCPSHKSLAVHKEIHSNGKIIYLTQNGGSDGTI